MTKNPQSKDDSLEALDFIVNVLKEHERDLDKLINELATVTEQLGDTGEISGKVENVEAKINTLQKEVTNLVTYMSSGVRKEAFPEKVTEQISAAPIQTEAVPVLQGKPSVLLRCKQWEDFQTLAAHAQTLSFNYKEDDKVFETDAIKGNQIITYSGPLPKFSSLLKASLSKLLEVPETNILEGVLAIA